MADIYLSLGTTIRTSRLATGKSLRELARGIGITPSYQSDIENDRRIPAEGVLHATAVALKLDFGVLMAKAGRLGEQVGRYLRQNPDAGALLRRLAETNASEKTLRKMLRLIP